MILNTQRLLKVIYFDFILLSVLKDDVKAKTHDDEENAGTKQ